jgi:ankyrin repeat protein
MHEKLIEALEKIEHDQHITKLLKSLKKDPNINIERCSAFDMPVIFYAVYMNYQEILSILLDSYKLDINQKGLSPDESLLHLAADLDRYDLASYLISKGADVNAQDKFKNTPLYYLAIRQRYTNIVELLLKNGANVNIKGELGDAPIHKAARINGDLTNLLLLHGANIYDTNKDHMTPLRISIKGEKKSCNTLLFTQYVLAGQDVSQYASTIKTTTRLRGAIIVPSLILSHIKALCLSTTQIATPAYTAVRAEIDNESDIDSYVNRKAQWVRQSLQDQLGDAIEFLRE